MGFLAAKYILVIWRLMLHVEDFWVSVSNAIGWALRCSGSAEILEPETLSWQECPEKSCAAPSAETIREHLPVATFGEFMQRFCEVEADFVCAVCLNEFEEDDQIRELCNCSHIFHKNCLDKWFNRYHNTCPLCRSPLLPDIAGAEVNREESSWLVDEICYLFAEDSAILPSHNTQ